jgi:hypothetical protein
MNDQTNPLSIKEIETSHNKTPTKNFLKIDFYQTIKEQIGVSQKKQTREKTSIYVWCRQHNPDAVI